MPTPRQPARGEPVAVLVSGGLDSAVLLDWACRRHRAVQPIYVRFGLRWERAELAALRRFLGSGRRSGLAPLAVLDMPVADAYGAHWSLTGRGVPGRRSADAAVHLPGRNLLLLAKAAVYGAGRGIDRFLVGTLRANPFPDATPRFFRSLSRTLSLALGRRIRVAAPFAGKNKAAVRRMAGPLPLGHIFSCLDPRRGRPCGRCNKCAELRRVLARPFGKMARP